MSEQFNIYDEGGHSYFMMLNSSLTPKEQKAGGFVTEGNHKELAVVEEPGNG